MSMKKGNIRMHNFNIKIRPELANRAKEKARLLEINIKDYIAGIIESDLKGGVGKKVAT